MGRWRHFDSLTNGRSISFSWWLPCLILAGPMWRLPRRACRVELRLLRPETGHSRRTFFRAGMAEVGRSRKFKPCNRVTAALRTAAIEV